LHENYAKREPLSVEVSCRQSDARAAQQLAATNKAHFPNESAEYRQARNTHLVEEIELRRHLVERVAAQHRALPQGGEILRNFVLVSETGPIHFSDLFGDKATLLVYSMMFGPQRKTPLART